MTLMNILLLALWKLVVVGELEMVQCREILIECQSTQEGEYAATWVPEYAGLYHCMVRANGINVHDQWAEVEVKENTGFNKFGRSVLGLFDSNKKK
mmetsp:Transcript_12814/g.36240  ORF Transcript_12814/g.36240 Transcript_12814/m.36240 type:complete len:96 (+) Transcript_12814:347-634(+)